MAISGFVKQLIIIPPGLKRFPIDIFKIGEGVVQLQVKQNAPKKESIDTIRMNQAINNLNSGNFYASNKEFQWVTNEEGIKRFYVELTGKEQTDNLYFKIEIEAKQIEGGIEKKVCHCHLINDLGQFLLSNIQKDEDDVDSISLFDKLENKRFVPVMLNSKLEELNGLELDFNAEVNNLHTEFVNNNLFYLNGDITASVVFPSEEVFDELEIQSCNLGLRLPFFTSESGIRNILTFSPDNLGGYIRSNSNIVVIKDSSGNDFVHNKSEDNEYKFSISLSHLTNILV